MAVVAVNYESSDGCFELPFEEVVFQKDAILEGLLPTFDLALDLGVHRAAADMFYPLFFEMRGQIVSEVRRLIVTDQRGLCRTSNEACCWANVGTLRCAAKPRRSY